MSTTPPPSPPSPHFPQENSPRKKISAWKIVAIAVTGIISACVAAFVVKTVIVATRDQPQDITSEIEKIYELREKRQSTDDLKEVAKMGDEAMNIVNKIGGANGLADLKEWSVFQKGLSDYAHTAAKIFKENWLLDAAKSQKNIDECLTNLNALRAKNKQNEENYRHLRDKARALSTGGATENQREFFQGFSGALERQSPLRQEIWLCENAMMECFTEIMTVFRDESGKWSHGASGEVAFQSEAAAKKYNEIWAKFFTYSERQTAAQKKLMEYGRQKLEEASNAQAEKQPSPAQG